jgi:sugar phosphate isomerase/epimerase
MSARFRIGNQTAFTAERPTQPFAYALANGFDAFEWFPDKKDSGAGWELSDIPPEARRRIRDEARSADIAMSVHVPWHANPLNRKSMPMIHECVGFARETGASLLNLHLFIEEGLHAYAAALAPVIEETREAGLSLSLENTPFTGPEDFNELILLLREGNSPADHVGVCFDLGHANLFEGTKNDYLSFLRRLSTDAQVIHVHLHENRGDRDSHLTLFTGPASESPAGIGTFLRVLRQRGFHGALILEQWPEPPVLLVEARERLLGILEEMEGQEE